MVYDLSLEVFQTNSGIPTYFSMTEGVLRQNRYNKLTKIISTNQGEQHEADKAEKRKTIEDEITHMSYGPPWAHYLGVYQDRLLGGPWDYSACATRHLMA
jgi:hypothetical protein